MAACPPATGDPFSSARTMHWTGSCSAQVSNRIHDREGQTGGRIMTLRSLVGIDLPIIQAPMAGAQGSALAVAVSNAGGLGSLPGALLSPDVLRQELAAIQAQTAKPFNVNFFCHAPPSPSA